MPDLKPYIDLITSGEVVAFPTETVYGLGADARNPSAIKKVFETKGRPSDNPLIVHISDIEQVQHFISEVPETARKLMAKFWPGPLTLVLKKKPDVLDLITAGLDTVAIRMPDHPLALEFISNTGPLVAPSANTSGRPSPTKAKHVLSDFGLNFPVIDGGDTLVGLESTVLDLSGETPTILRPGKIGKEDIESVIGSKVIMQTDSADHEVDIPKSPGQKYSHYKPNADVLYQEPSDFSNSTFFLVQHSLEQSSPNIISYDGDLQLMSKELYDRFRQADHEGYSKVVIAPIENFESSSPALYNALINRIQKAVGK